MSLKLSISNIDFGIAGFLLTSMALQAFWLFSLMGFELPIAFADPAISYLLLYAFYLFLRYNPGSFFNFQANFVLTALLSLALTIIWLFLNKYLLLNLFNDANYAAFWLRTIFIRGFIGWLLIFGLTFMVSLISKLQEYTAINDQKQAMEQLRKEAELFKLRQQFQPHFLFNSLNSINALIGQDPQMARKMVQHLSQYLRNNIGKNEEQQICIKDELADLKLYLAIELVRFGHRLMVEENFNLLNQDSQIPPFLIQPLV